MNATKHHIDIKDDRKTIKWIPLNRSLIALIDTILPEGEKIKKIESSKVIDGLKIQFSKVPFLRTLFFFSIMWINIKSIIRTLRPFRFLKNEKQAYLLNKWSKGIITKGILQIISAPLKIIYLTDDEILKPIDCKYGVDTPVTVEEERWMQKVISSADMEESEEIEAEIVIVGTGAGGAVAAYELASRGHAVAIVEEGEYFTRKDFNGKIFELINKLYRANGLTAVIGKQPILMGIAKMVGGTTAVNAATCFNTPDEVLNDWSQSGLKEHSPEEMKPYFEKLKDILNIQPAEWKHIGKIGDIVKRGADKLGLKKVMPMNRNTIDCDGQGLCSWGCPTDAKQSTNITFIPMALKAGAYLYTGFRVDKLIKKNKTVKGIVARGVKSKKKINLTIKADTVIISMGSLITPLFLKNNGIKNKNVGKHLSIHPCGSMAGTFPGEQFDNLNVISQGLAIKDFSDKGVVLEGATFPPVFSALTQSDVGKDFVKRAERYNNTGFYNFMIKDDSRGRVRRTFLKTSPSLFIILTNLILKNI